MGFGSSGISAFRREFKLTDKIGGTEEKRLDYISLCSQVMEAKRRGFTADEVVFGLKRAVASGSELRMYLDSLPSLTLEEVMDVIRGSYKEKSAADLFQELNLMTQNETEDAQHFLFRALALRQRILATAEAEGETHDTKLVYNAFLHALRTGIRHESMRMHMHPFLDKTKHVSDSILLAEVNNAMSEQSARSKKLECSSERKKAVRFDPTIKVSQVKVEDVAATVLQQVVSPLLEAIHNLNKDMLSMKTDFGKLLNDKCPSAQTGKFNQKVAKKKKVPICKNCLEKGESQCQHCFKCLNEGHQTRDCKSSLN